MVPRPDLVYSEGHIRRRLIDSRQTLFGGHRQFELSSAAGAGCSGAPVLLDHPAHDAWQVIGVYVGQRSNETEGITVGHAVRIGGDSWFTGWVAMGLALAKHSRLLIASEPVRLWLKGLQSLYVPKHSGTS